MIKKETPVYFCSITDKVRSKVSNLSEIADHQVGEFDGRRVIIPIKIDSDIINPRNFLKLKEQLEIEEILFLDKIKGTEAIIQIEDHINCSGQNFLRSKTPEGELPQFPDMSKIYNDLEGFEKLTVQTVGVDRFKTHQEIDNEVISESIGLIAPVANYVGLKIFALGFNNLNETLDVI